MKRRLRVIVPASTSNLGSGFDTISAALSLHLSIEVDVTDEGRVQWVSGWDLPLEDNAADVALRRTFGTLGLEEVGLRLAMSNPIPLKRGLGSSGAAIIAGIKIAEAVAGRQLSQDQILNLAYPIEGHPDNIAASLLGGWVISRVAGNRMWSERIASPLSCRFVLAVPETLVSTRAARNILPDCYTREDTVQNLQRCALFVHALHAGRKDLLRQATQDRLHQAFRASLVPGIQDLLEYRGLAPGLEEHLLSVTISGSGSGVIGIADAQYDEIGCWMVNALRDRGTTATFLVLNLDQSGARIVDL